MKAWTAALPMLVGSTIAFLQYGIPWFVYGALYYSILAIPILLFDGCASAPLAPAARAAPQRALLRWRARPCPHQIPGGGMQTEKPV
jgi:hypothetical protein